MQSRRWRRAYSGLQTTFLKKKRRSQAEVKAVYVAIQASM